MSTQAVPTNDRGLSDWAALARELGPRFAARASSHDAADSFVADNYRDLRERRVFSAGVPAELGGGGASHAELCTLVRVLGQHCGSTALALSMHTHQVATAAWRWRHEGAPTELLLRRVADQEAILVTMLRNEANMGLIHLSVDRAVQSIAGILLAEEVPA